MQQFVDKWLGKKADFDGHYGGQCVDLYRFYVKEVLGFPQSPGVGGAAEIWDSASPEYYDFIKNDPLAVPEPGDIIIWNRRVGGGFGHVAIFLHGDVNRFTSLDQNWPTLDKVTETEHTYSSVIGWLRPKEPMSDALQECLRQHKSLVDETVELKKEVERLRTQIERERSDFDNAKKDYEERLKEAKNDFSTLVKALADTLGTNQNQEAIRAKMIEILDTVDTHKDFVRNMSNILNTTQKFTEMLAYAEHLVLNKDSAKKESDIRADLELKYKQQIIDLEGEITKLRMQLESKDIPEDIRILFKALFNAMVKKIERIIDSYKKEPRK